MKALAITNQNRSADGIYAVMGYAKAMHHDMPKPEYVKECIGRTWRELCGVPRTPISFSYMERYLILDPKP